MSSDKEFPIFKHLDADQIEAVKDIDKIYSANGLKGPRFATGKVLHFYGQFTDELPKKFQPDGPNGQQFIKCKSNEEAENICQELRAFIFKKWPDTVEWG